MAASVVVILPVVASVVTRFPFLSVVVVESAAPGVYALVSFITVPLPVTHVPAPLPDGLALKVTACPSLVTVLPLASE